MARPYVKTVELCRAFLKTFTERKIPVVASPGHVDGMWEFWRMRTVVGTKRLCWGSSRLVFCAQTLIFHGETTVKLDYAWTESNCELSIFKSGWLTTKQGEMYGWTKQRFALQLPIILIIPFFSVICFHCKCLISYWSFTASSCWVTTAHLGFFIERFTRPT